MRDARTVRHHEPIVFHQSGYVIRHGKFAAVVNIHGAEYLRIELADGVYDVLASSDQMWVTDAEMTVLGIPEPPLPTTPADLE